MALFVDLDDEGTEPPQQGGNPIWNGLLPHRTVNSVNTDRDDEADKRSELEAETAKEMHNREAHESTVSEIPNPNRNSMTEALGCYP
jgi:hypothetical protein